MSEGPGVDLDALARWLDVRQPGLRRTGQPLQAELLTGGKSNLTYRITDGAETWALRRPPLAHVLPTAHDMAREFRVISALLGSGVPVPASIALCEDAAVLGAPFYLMSFVDGIVLDRPEALAQLTPAAARRCGELLVDTLSRLHDIEPASVGLADFGHPDGFLSRQVARWERQWQASATQPRAEIDEIVRRLSAAQPDPPTPAIVHGDYRLTNVMYGRDFASIAAVIDWEMATVGDPFTDLGLLVVYQTLAAQGALVMPRMSADAGFLTPEELVARYRASSARKLADLGWYVGFGYFKLAVVAEGIHHRYRQGKTVGAGFAHFGPAVPQLLAAALGQLGG
jgi:aminoglycoside phosphotransferase (APT) family kinase protein